MRIGLLIYGSLDTVSGGYLYNRQLVRYLESCGDTVEIISLPYRGYWRHLSDNVNAGLLARLVALKIDVLIQDEMNYPSLLWLNERLRKRVSYSLVSLVHLLSVTDSSQRSRMALHQKLEARYLHSVDGFICTSVTTRQDIEQRFGIFKPTVVALPGGDRFEVKPDSRTGREGAHKHPLKLLYVGNVIRRKGLHTVLRAMQDVAGVELWVVGPISAEPDYTAELFNLIQQYNLYHRVQFIGPHDGAALARHYANSDAFVMPSSYESFGIVYLEALQFGLPVIGTTAGAAHELITHRENGFLIEPDDAVALARYLVQLRDDIVVRETMSSAAQARFAQHPRWEESMALVKKFLIGQCDCCPNT